MIAKYGRDVDALSGPDWAKETISPGALERIWRMCWWNTFESFNPPVDALAVVERVIVIPVLVPEIASGGAMSDWTAYTTNASRSRGFRESETVSVTKVFGASSSIRPEIVIIEEVAVMPFTPFILFGCRQDYFKSGFHRLIINESLDVHCRLIGKRLIWLIFIKFW